jgi:hypothetical protein
MDVTPHRPIVMCTRAGGYVGVWSGLQQSKKLRTA